MKPHTRKALLYAFCATMLCTFTHCDKMPANGVLDGMWQLTEITSLGNNGEAEDVREERLYMSFQLDLVQLTQSHPEHLGRTINFGHFTHKNQEIRIYDLCKGPNYESATDTNKPYTEQNIHDLNKWGIHRLDNHFKVEVLNSQKMVLQDDSVQLTLRKF